jgi:hypothetical protein
MLIVLVVKHKGKMSFGRTRRMRECIKMQLKGSGWDGMDRIHLAQDIKL